MKKIILSATLLGSFYFANAQVGIGTPMPATSAMLDITADDKGVLIPRINLTALNDFAPVEGTKHNGLLVFATGEKDDKSASDVTSGFYYWNVNKWERIVNQTQLDEVISNQADIAKIKDLLNAAYGSNNLGDTVTSDSFGGMVFTPADGSSAAKFEYVTWDPTLNNGDGGYKKSDITTVITDLINASETKTKIVTIDDVQYYVSESYTGTADPTSENETGVYKIDVVGGVINNIEEIFTTPTTIIINEGQSNQETFTTVQQYIEYISQNIDLKDGVMTFVLGTGATTEAQLASSSFTYNVTDANGVTTTVTVNFSDLIKANESKTTFLEFPADSGKFYYISEATIKQNGNGPAITTPYVANAASGTLRDGVILLDMPGEVAQNFSTFLTQVTNVSGPNNTNLTVEQVIQNITMKTSGNVGYTTTGITAGTPTGQLEIPANSFYYVNDNGIKVEIPLNDIVYTGITNLTETQVNDVKIKLGDNFKTTTVVKTGDVWTDGKAVYKGIFDAFIKNGTANVVKTATDSDYSEISISGTVGQIISISVLDSNGNKLTSSVTDVVTASTGVKFRIGTGNMYNVIYPGTGTTAIKVLIEYSAGAVVTP